MRRSDVPHIISKLCSTAPIIPRGGYRAASVWKLVSVYASESSITLESTLVCINFSKLHMAVHIGSFRGRSFEPKNKHCNGGGCGSSSNKFTPVGPFVRLTERLVLEPSTPSMMGKVVLSDMVLQEHCS